MAALSQPTLQLTEQIPLYLASTNKQTFNLAQHLQTLGDEARLEEKRKTYTPLLPAILDLINHRPFIPTQDLVLAVRLVGNLVVDNDAHRQLCNTENTLSSIVGIFDAVATKRIPEKEARDKLEINTCGLVGNLACDNAMLQQSLIKAGVIPLLTRVAIFGSSASSQKMASNASCCFESSKLLSSIAFYHIDHLTSQPLPPLNHAVTESTVEALIDMIDEQDQAYEEMKRSPRSWVNDVVALTKLILNTIDKEEKVEVSSSTTTTGSTTTGSTTATNKYTGSLHVCGGLLAHTYKMTGPQTFINMSNNTLNNLSWVVARLCQHHEQKTMLIRSPEMAEALGIFNGALANVCGDLAGCLRIFQAKASLGLVASARLDLEENKGIQSGGLVALRNLCLASHQQQRQFDDQNGIKLEQAKQVEQKASTDARTTMAPTQEAHNTFEFCSNAFTIAFNGCKHTNVSMALAGVGTLRQAIGNTSSTIPILEALLNEKVWDWLLSGFTDEALAVGNKGQCECARIVCLVVTLLGPKMFGKNEERNKNVMRCIELLQKFEDPTLKMEAEKCLTAIQVCESSGN